jgi:hypothetical protein
MSDDKATYEQLRCAMLFLCRMSDFSAPECDTIDWSAPEVMKLLFDAGIVDWDGHGYYATPERGVAVYQALVTGRESTALRMLAKNANDRP